MILLNTSLRKDETNLLDTVECFRLDANRKVDSTRRSEFGQFMTGAPIAKFMASLFNNMSGEIRLLDAGAAVGSLTAAFIKEACARTEKPKSINTVTYEIDPIFIEYLNETLKNCQNWCKLYDIKFKYQLIKDDFIKSGGELLSFGLFTNSQCPQFTHTILNPPYRKILSSSDHRKLLRSIGIETSNLYTGFLSIAIKLLKKHGEIVAIVPRSFCNGLYFKPFRKLLISQTSIKHIHVFVSRQKAFNDDEVLQENIIFHAVKGGIRDKVLITSSSGPDFEDMTQHLIAYEKVIKPNDPEKFIHIATSELDQYIIDRITIFNQSLEKLEINVSTGPVVDFRLKNDLQQNPVIGSVPLLYPCHFEHKNLIWPKDSKKPNAINISSNSRKWLWYNKGYYVITRRFTSKEEKRRIVANIYDSSLPGELIGFENHLNIFHKVQKGLPRNIAIGLSIYLNSTLIDKYFRQFSGHTQVNSTDLRSIPYPSLQILEYLGSQVKDKYPNQREIDYLINKEIEPMSDTRKFDPILAQQKIDEAIEIIKALGFPKGQHNERSALTLLAILNLRPDGSWQNAERPLMGITPIMDFCRDVYGKQYAPNTRETFRRQTMHQFVDAGIAIYNPDKSDRPVNSPKACYQISIDAYEVIITFETKAWDKMLASFLKRIKTLAKRYAMEREMKMIPVTINDETQIRLTPGSHSKLIKEIIEEFGPRFVPDSQVIYVGDTGDKIGYLDDKKLNEIGIEIDKHGKMPDVILYYSQKNWLLLIESVTSHGPVDAKRHNELSKLFNKSNAGLVYVTAFPDRITMAKYLVNISWETEVWVSEAPTHIIHFNGERFLGPYINKL